MQYKIIIFILLSVSKFADSFICHAAIRPNSNIPTVVTLLKAKVTPNQGESMDEYRKVYFLCNIERVCFRKHLLKL